MKKFATKLIAALAFAAVASAANAALTQSVNVVLTMANLSVFSPTNGGNVNLSGGPNGDVVADRVVFKNDGASVERFTVKLLNAGTNWALITGDHTANPTMGINQYRLSSIWHQFDVIPSTAEFQNNDILTPGEQFSSITTFFNDGETNGHITGVFPTGTLPAATQAGSVPTNEDRNLFIRAELPAAGSVPVETNSVIVTAGLP